MISNVERVNPAGKNFLLYRGGSIYYNNAMTLVTKGDEVFAFPPPRI